MVPDAGPHPHTPAAPITDKTYIAGTTIHSPTDCSSHDAQRIVGGWVSDTALRAGRDESIGAGVFGPLVDESMTTHDQTSELSRVWRG